MSKPHRTAHTLRRDDPQTLKLLLPPDTLSAPSASPYRQLAEQLVHDNHVIDGLYTHDGIEPLDAHVHIHAILHHTQLGYCDTINAVAALLHAWCDSIITRDQYDQHHFTDRYGSAPINDHRRHPNPHASSA